MLFRLLQRHLRFRLSDKRRRYNGVVVRTNSLGSRRIIRPRCRSRKDDIARGAIHAQRVHPPIPRRTTQLRGISQLCHRSSSAQKSSGRQ